MIKVKASKHPFRDDWVEAQVEPGQTIRQIVGRDIPVHAWIDGREVPAYLIENARIKDGVEIVVRPVPQDGEILRSVLLVAVMVAATVVTAGGAAGVFAALGQGTFAAAAAGAAIGMAGTFLVNTLIPPQAPKSTGEADSFNRLQALTGASNRVAAFQAIPRLYGTFRYFPPIPMTGKPYTEVNGSDQYLRMILVLGYGPLSIGGITVGEGHAIIDENTSLTGIPIKVGETDIHQYDDVEFEIGTADQMTLYTDEIIESNPAWNTSSDVSGIALDAGGQWIADGDITTRTTDTNADEISVEFTGRLFSVNDEGKTTFARVEWKVEYSPVGAGSWTTVENPFRIYSSRRETVRKGLRWKVSPGQYDVRVTRIRTFHQDFEATANDFTWNALRTIRSKQAFDVDGMVCMAVRIKATDQLNGRLDELNIEATSVLPVWSGSAWVEQATNNPAWIYADVWTGTANRRPLAQAKLDTTELLDWANLCITNGYEYNAVIDATRTVLDLAQEVAAAGRATWDITPDSKITVVQDTDQTVPKMVITPRNSFDYQYEMAAVAIPHALRIQFIDENTWENTERLVFDDGFDENNSTLYESLSAPGVTSDEQAWKYGRYHLAQQKLRPERHSFSQDIQHLRYRRGHLLTLAHDVILTGLRWGRAKLLKGAALFFDGVNDSVVVDDTAELYSFVGNSPFTIEAVVRHDGVDSPNDFPRVVERAFSDGGGTQGWYLLYQRTANRIAFSRLLNSAAVSVSTDLAIGEEAHVAVTYDGADLRLYKNGVLSHGPISSPASLVSQADSMFIGNLATGSTSRPWHGIISEFRIWDFARDAADILADKDVRMTGGEEGLVCHLPMHEGQGSTLNNLVQGTSDGTITGAVWNESIMEYNEGEPVFKLTADEFLPIADHTKFYGLKFQRRDGSIITQQIKAVIPGSTEVEFTQAVDDIYIDDHFIFGEFGSESIDVKVSSIEPQGDYIARITCVPAAPDVLLAETGAIPPFDPVITTPVNPDKIALPIPEIETIISDETVLLRDTDGSSRIRMVVESKVARFPGWDASRQVRYREQGSDLWILTEPNGKDAISVFDIDEAVTYELQIRSVRGNKVSPWNPSTPLTHTVVGKSSPPRDVTGFAATAARDRIELSWTANPDADIDHYEVREGASWAAGTLVVKTDGIKHQTPTPSNGPWWIKAFDTSGNESVNAVQATISVVNPQVTSTSGQVVDNNVLLKWAFTLGTFDLETFEIRRGVALESATVLGKSDATFKVIFETAAGEYTYWVVPVDRAGNEGSALSKTLTVDEPPAFVLRNTFQTDWEGNVNTDVQKLNSTPAPYYLNTFRHQTCVEFNGDDDQYIQSANNSGVDSPTDPFTFELLLELLDEAPGVETLIFGSDTTYSGAYGIFREAETDDIVFAVRDSNSLAVYNRFTPYIGKLMHIAGVNVGDGNCHLYLDGELIDTGSVVFTGTLDVVKIAANKAADFSGTTDPGQQHMRVAEMRFWSDVRSQVEIQTWMNRTLHGDEANLELYWRAQEGSGDTIGDKSGNGQDGVIVGSPEWLVPNISAIAPFDITETPNDKIAATYDSPQELIDAGFNYVPQPCPTSAQFVEVYDAGTVIPSTKIKVTIGKVDLVAGATTQITISTKENIGDAWTDHPAGQDEVFASTFRYVKVTMDVTSDGTDLLLFSEINAVLSTKQKTDAGNINVTANPTAVLFNVAFIDIENISVTPQGTVPLTAIYDFVDAPNPVGFDIHLFDNTGNPATGTVRWTADGV